MPLSLATLDSVLRETYGPAMREANRRGVAEVRAELEAHYEQNPHLTRGVAWWRYGPPVPSWMLVPNPRVPVGDYDHSWAWAFDEDDD